MSCQGHARRCFHLPFYFQCSHLLISYRFLVTRKYGTLESVCSIITDLLGYPYGLTSCLFVSMSRTNVFLDLWTLFDNQSTV